ncbi:hypothetical protein C8R47DRAFT_108430 [Mycena vitilis]|nr:hypothetical protein C8R47DRAFT_108430 [Mycena vitilis]
MSFRVLKCVPERVDRDIQIADRRARCSSESRNYRLDVSSCAAPSSSAYTPQRAHTQPLISRRSPCRWTRQVAARPYRLIPARGTTTFASHFRTTSAAAPILASAFDRDLVRRTTAQVSPPTTIPNDVADMIQYAPLRPAKGAPFLKVNAQLLPVSGTDSMPVPIEEAVAFAGCGNRVVSFLIWTNGCGELWYSPAQSCCFKVAHLCAVVWVVRLRLTYTDII